MLRDLSLVDWKRVLAGSFKEAGRDNLSLAAAGVAFYIFLAIVPLLLSAVLIYGLAADPATIASHVAAIAENLPGSATALIEDQLKSIVEESDGKKGFGLLLALSFALFSARNGAAATITALGIAYECEESRGFLRLTLLALLVTVGGIVGAAAVGGAIFAVTSLGPDDGGSAAATLLKLATYAVLLVGGMAAAATLYRYAPDRAEPRWRWVTAGSAFAGLGWVLLTIGFGYYVDNFGNYDATFGSLSAVIVLLTWLYLSAYVLLLGAEINSVARRHAAAQA